MPVAVTEADSIVVEHLTGSTTPCCPSQGTCRRCGEGTPVPLATPAVRSERFVARFGRLRPAGGDHPSRDST